LLLSRCDAYSYLSKFIAVEITSTIRQIAAEVALGEEEGLPRFCVANNGLESGRKKWDNRRTERSAR
jgi:hypothetical protein